MSSFEKTPTTPSLPKSARILNYCKASAATLTAAAALGALFLSVYASYNPPEEHVAKSTYKEVKRALTKIQSDMQRAYEEREQVVEECDLRIKALEGRMTAFLSGVTVGLGVNKGSRKLQRQEDSTLKPKIPLRRLNKVFRAPAPQQQFKFKAPQQYKLKPLQQMSK